MGPWAIYPGGWHPCPRQVGWSWMFFKVLSSPTFSVMFWNRCLYVHVYLYICMYRLREPSRKINRINHGRVCLLLHIYWLDHVQHFQYRKLSCLLIFLNILDKLWFFFAACQNVRGWFGQCGCLIDSTACSVSQMKHLTNTGMEIPITIMGSCADFSPGRA